MMWILERKQAEDEKGYPQSINDSSILVCTYEQVVDFVRNVSSMLHHLPLKSLFDCMLLSRSTSL